VGLKSRHLLGAEDMTAFVRDLSAAAPARLDIVHSKGPVIDPDTGQQLGVLVLPVGQLEITRRDAGIATARISKSRLAVHAGDRLLPPHHRSEPSQFRLRIPTQPIAGTIIATYSGAMMLGPYDVVVINRGASSGLQRGNLLHI